MRFWVSDVLFWKRGFSVFRRVILSAHVRENQVVSECVEV